jgi:hypothetical protein
MSTAAANGDSAGPIDSFPVLPKHRKTEDEETMGMTKT